MKTFKFSFEGRQSGAIGIFYQITDSYKANDLQEALSLLYEDYEHIGRLKITCNGKSIETPEKINFVKVRSNRERPRQQDKATYIYNNF